MKFDPSQGGTTMQTKIRTTIATLAATFAVAVAVAPAAQALPTRVPIGTPGGNIPTIGVAESKNDGRYKDSAEGRKAERYCARMQEMIDHYRDQYYREKDKDPRSEATAESFRIWGMYVNAFADAKCRRV